MGLNMRSITSERCVSSRNRRSVSKSLPNFSTQIDSYVLIIISSTSGSARNSSIGPKPRIFSRISLLSWSFPCSILSGICSVSRILSTSFSTFKESSSRLKETPRSRRLRIFSWTSLLNLYSSSSTPLSEVDFDWPLKIVTPLVYLTSINSYDPDHQKKHRTYSALQYYFDK